MVFQSVPVYLDPPNWHHHHQQQNQHQLIPSHDSLHLIPQPPNAAGGAATGGGSMGSIRPGSMSDRARLAKLPLPEPGLKCPRCESTNTKFCYFNNYSLSQPRHFCKTCRRYWTRGGALRNVPVGGGCRRNNKRGKGTTSRSKSPVATADRRSNPSTTTNSSSTNLNSSLPPQLPFLLGGYGMGAGIQPPSMGFQMTGGSSSGASDEGFRLPHAAVQQFPFLTGLEQPQPPPPPHGNDHHHHELYPFQSSDGVKLEGSNGGLMGIHGGNDQYNWSNSNAWPDLL